MFLHRAFASLVFISRIRCNKPFTLNSQHIGLGVVGTFLELASVYLSICSVWDNFDWLGIMRLKACICCTEDKVSFVSSSISSFFLFYFLCIYPVEKRIGRRHICMCYTDGGTYKPIPDIYDCCPVCELSSKTAVAKVREVIACSFHVL